MYMNILKNFMKYKEYSIRGEFKSEDPTDRPIKKVKVAEGPNDVFEREHFHEEEDVDLI
jgi:major membrane immunogen (membrane-anchored lipoprotein)